jgi:hypothetical protein
MIKASGRHPDGKPIALIGLSGENITRLMANEPIRFNLSQIGLADIHVMIVAGPTETDILHTLADAGLIDRNTTRHDDTSPDAPA